MQPAGLDVIIRIYDPSELPRLHQCLFALLAQSLPASPCDARSCEPLRLHLMLRRFTFAELRAVRTATEALRPLDQTATLTLHNWELPEPFDLRLPLLNWGLEVAQGRYFTCLGVGDLVLPGAYAKLLTRLQSTRAAVAVGGVLRQPVRWWGDVVLPLASPHPDSMPDGSRDAEVPPVFMVDRARLPPQDAVFRVGSPDAEVAEFVQRVRATQPIDTEYMAELLGVHQIPG